MSIARIAEQFDYCGEVAEPLPVVVPDAPVDSQTITDLLATVARLTARVAELELPPAQWAPLKTAAIDRHVEYETLRSWAVTGLIEARREGGRWFVNVVSVRARQLRLAAPRAK